MNALLERRQLLRAALALGCLPFTGAGTSPDERASVAELIPPHVEEAARRVGARCRAAGVIADEGALLAGCDGKSAQALAAFLARKVRADFAADRMVSIGPWWLAETECRILALL